MEMVCCNKCNEWFHLSCIGTKYTDGTENLFSNKLIVYDTATILISYDTSK